MTESAPSIDVLFEDHHLIAVHKPTGVLTQAPAHVPSLEAMVKEYIKIKHATPAGVYLGIPHRLEKPMGQSARSDSIIEKANLNSLPGFVD